MNPSHVVATGGVTAQLAIVFVWLSHWPLQPLTPDVALAVAGLIVSAVGAAALAWSRRHSPPQEPPPAGGQP